MRRIHPLVWGSVLALLLALTGATPAHSYLVMTEKVCYSPGETVVVLGDGWGFPADIVEVTFTRYPLDVEPVVLQTVVDENGRFRLAEYVEPPWPTDLPEGARYYTIVSAVGQSGNNDYAAFGDVQIVGSVGIGPLGPWQLEPGGTLTADVVVSRGWAEPYAKGGFTVDLSLAPDCAAAGIVGPCPFEATLSPSTLTFAPGEESKSARLTLTSSCDMATGDVPYTLTAKRQGCGLDSAVATGTLPLIPLQSAVGSVDFSSGDALMLIQGGTVSTTVTLHRASCVGGPFSAELSFHHDPYCDGKRPIPPYPVLTGTFAPSTVEFAEGELTKTVVLTVDMPCDLIRGWNCPITVIVSNAGIPGSVRGFNLPYQVSKPPRLLAMGWLEGNFSEVWPIEAGGSFTAPITVHRDPQQTAPFGAIVKLFGSLCPKLPAPDPCKPPNCPLAPGPYPITAVFSPDTLWFAEGEESKTTSITIGLPCELPGPYLDCQFWLRAERVGGCESDVTKGVKFTPEVTVPPPGTLAYIKVNRSDWGIPAGSIQTFGMDVIRKGSGSTVAVLQFSSACPGLSATFAPDTLIIGEVGHSMVTLRAACDLRPKTYCNVSFVAIEPAGGPCAKVSFDAQMAIGPHGSPPVPMLDPLPPLVAQCRVEVTRPLATDFCPDTVVATTEDPLIYDAPGKYLVHWTYTDAFGRSTAQEQQVEVVSDITPPAISVAVAPNELWPPNNKLVDVHATVKATDAGDPAPIFTLTSIALVCDRDKEEVKDGTKPEFAGAEFGTADVDFQLRAEKGTKACDLTYTIVYTAKDRCGNTATASATVRVPHDRRGQAQIASGGSGGAGKAAQGASLSLVIPSIVQVPVSEDPLDEAASGERTPLFTFDARNVNPAQTWMGNSSGLVAPSSVAESDLTGDGYEDLVLSYESSALDELLALPVTLDDPMTFYYRALNGIGYEVAVPLPGGLAPQAATTVASGKAAQAGPGTGGAIIPKVTQMGPGTPNPSRGTMTFALDLASDRATRVEVYDLRGALVRTLLQGVQPAGRYLVTWNGADNGGRRLPNGVYLVRVEAGAYHAMRKAVLVK